jgi:AcrR family transcriptional regulator
MPRPPKARLRILDAAERIVKDRGAANLTYEELVHESGVSRGGITYHFATKNDLLRALIERDVAQGRAAEARLLAQVDAGPGADVIARIRAWGTPDEDRKRLVAGLLSAVAHDPGLLEPVRRMHTEECALIEWTDTEILRAILRLAAEGLFWSEFFGCSEVPPEQRARLVARLEALAREWSGGAA